MGRRQQRSLRSKAVHLVSDFTTVLLNPISDKPSKASPLPDPPPPSDDERESETGQLESISEVGSEVSNEGPDTSSFTAFLYSFLSTSEHGDDGEECDNDETTESERPEFENVLRDSGMRKSLFSRGKQSIGKAVYYAARLGGYRSSGSERKGNSEIKVDDSKDSTVSGEAGRVTVKGKNEAVKKVNLPEMSDQSLLLSENTRCAINGWLPTMVKGRKWVLLYSTWKHGISLSTLYRRSMLCPGPNLLVVGDRKGAVFGGMVDAPLRPSQSKKYQGSNSTFLFKDLPGQPAIYRPTGANRYYTLCSPDFLACGGGAHFALYLESDLLNGSSAASDTYGNPCLAQSQDFEVKEVELWGFVYASKYEEMLTLCRTEAPGICRW